MRGSVVLMLLLLVNKELVISVRIVEMRIPAYVALGDEALLSCQYDMEGDQLRSIKWYKDGREFYRFVPRDATPARVFPTRGVNVDLPRSSSNLVTLQHMTRNSTGLYRCEVTGEAPSFTTAHDDKNILVYLVPDKPPNLSGQKLQYKIGDRLVVNCTSPPSDPESQLQWFINEHPAPDEYLQGPWYRVSVDHSLETQTVLQLKFIVDASHFVHGQMKLKCQATIAPLYQKEAVHVASRYVAKRPQWVKDLDKTSVIIPVKPPIKPSGFGFIPTVSTDTDLVALTTPSPLPDDKDDKEGQAAAIHKSLPMLFITGMLLVII